MPNKKRTISDAWNLLKEKILALDTDKVISNITKLENGIETATKSKLFMAILIIIIAAVSVSKMS